MKHVHLIGIGGSGLSAIARVLQESGYVVTGSDRTLSPLAQELMRAGVKVAIGHAAENIQGADLVVRSSAIPDDNPEVQAACAAGIPVLKRAEFLSRLMSGQIGIAVAGTHGKTTTTAMIAWIFTRLGKDPSYIIGGVSKDLGSNAHAGSSPYFIIEADEYDRMFLGLEPNMIVLTALEYDHPDCFPTPDNYRQAFLDFTSRLKPGGALLACLDDEGTQALLPRISPTLELWTYGASPEANYQAGEVALNAKGGASFTAFFRPPAGTSQLLAQVNLQVPGRHNLYNALAALAAAHRMGLPAGQAAQALADFTGTGRRFDLQGEANNIVIIDDYAHHPTEIRATLAAARDRYPQRRLWAVWQPHTYSRTQSLLQEFALSFQDADRVLITAIYGAREQNASFSAGEIVTKIPGQKAVYVPELEQAAAYLLQQLQSGDVLLVLSAGDADQISAGVLAGLRERKRED